MKRHERKAAFYLVSPSFIGFAVLFLIPFLMSIFYSFFQGVGNSNFIGFSNYMELFASSAFRLAVTNTVVFMVVGIPLLFATSLGLASMCDYLYQKKLFGYSFWFVLALIPMIVPTGSVVMFFRILFVENGVINGFLYHMNIPTVNWLESNWGFWVMMLLFLWKNTSYCTVFLLAGMRTVDKGTVEAASLDGASGWKIFWRIRIPQIRPFIFFTLLIAIMSVFKVYRETYHLVGDYPPSSMYMLQNFMNNNFNKLNTQRLTASSVLFFIVLSGGIYLLMRKSMRDDTRRV